MSYNINSKMKLFNNYISQPIAEGKDKIGIIANELVEAILKNNGEDFTQELASLVRTVKQLSSSQPGCTKIISQAERIFKACEQKGIEIDFPPALERSITRLEARAKRLNLLAGIDDKTLGFIHGDSFLSASGLEGRNTNENINFLLPYLKEGELLQEKNHVIELLEECVLREDKMKPIFNSIRKDPFETYLQQADKYSEFLSEKVRNCKKVNDF